MIQGDKSAQKQTPPEQFSAYVVIPSVVFFDRKLTDRAKLLYGLISCMCNHRGYCWARNDTLARYLGTESDRTIRRLLGELRDGGHIVVDQTNEGGATIRKIHITAAGCADYRPDKNDRPPGQKCPDRPDKNDRQNNNSFNIPPIVPQGDGGGDAPKMERKPRVRVDAKNQVILSEEQERGFSEFWRAYPRSEGLQPARKAWAKLDPDPELQQTILDAITVLKTTDQWLDGKAPHGSTFLNNARWQDAEELAPAAQQGGMEQW